MLNAKELREKFNNGDLTNDVTSVLRYRLQGAADELRKKGDTETAAKAQQYSEVFSILDEMRHTFLTTQR